MLFSTTEIEAHAHPSVLETGRELSRGTALGRLQIINTDVVATFTGRMHCTAVISRNPDGIQSACTCGFGYGGACEHIVAAMLAANNEQAIQTGLDLGAGADINPAETDAAPSEPIETITGSPTPRLYLKEIDELLVVDLRFAYLNGAAEFRSFDRSREKLVIDASGKALRLHRAMAREMRVRSMLKDSGLTPFRAGSYTPVKDSALWIRTELPKLESFEVFGKETLVTGKTSETVPKMELVVTRRDDGMVDCFMDIGYDGTPVHLGRVYDAIFSGKEYVKLTDGSTGRIPDAWIEKLAIVFALCEKRPEGKNLFLQETSAEALRLLESIADDSSWEGTREKGRGLLEKMDDMGKNVSAPKSLRGELRSYQHAGYEWLCVLRKFHVGGCLADDMGLGKTVQALALLLRVKERAERRETSLLVMPSTLLFNWQREIQTFAPSLLFMVYHGLRRKRHDAGAIRLADLVLTTYGTVLRDGELLREIDFNYIILDEAQVIKNPLSKTSRAVRGLKAKNRLALSGTPIENNLSELWSLFTFLNPGMLGNYRRFTDTFIKPIESDRRDARAGVLREIIRPCILRRTKDQVAKELPEKTEVVLKVPMLPRQRALYEITRDAYRKSIMEAVETIGMEKSRIHILHALVRLRQICCHPLLVDASFKGDACKFEALNDLLDVVIGEKHKALVFSQFVGVLELIRAGLDGRGIKHEYLTGSTKDRQVPVDNFQKDSGIPLMLISLKAGGVGLNLTAADYVVLFDPWWNPAVENQAADRAHRIGQKKPVFVYKLIAEDSVEERVLELQQSKRELFDAIITSEASVFKEMRRDDIRRLFE